MIRQITFALPAVTIALGAMSSGISNVGDWGFVLAVVVILGWLVILNVCKRGPFADFLTTVD